MPSILCLLVIWLLVLMAVRMVSSAKPSHVAVLEFLNKRPGVTGSDGARHAWIGLMASHLSRLDVDSRHLALMNPRMRSAFLELPQEDQSHFLAAIQQRGMKEFIEGSKGWSLGRYERLMQPALADLEGLQGGSGERFEAMLARPGPESVQQAG
ncbi:MAG: hypothetical protein V4710_10195, partial [Verrucomicrobiota bacterium]